MNLRNAPAALLCAAVLSGCASTASTTHVSPVDPPKPIPLVDARDRDCLTRAMYFESNRSSDEGLLSVGTVVMNRVESGRFPPSVCGVVGQKRQFAPGVMTRAMKGDRERVGALAERILRGERVEKLGKAAYFHAKGLRFRYGNMRYVHVAGGNAFYEKVERIRRAPAFDSYRIVSSMPVPVPTPAPRDLTVASVRR